MGRPDKHDWRCSPFILDENKNLLLLRCTTIGTVSWVGNGICALHEIGRGYLFFNWQVIQGVELVRQRRPVDWVLLLEEILQ